MSYMALVAIAVRLVYHCSFTLLTFRLKMSVMVATNRSMLVNPLDKYL